MKSIDEHVEKYLEGFISTPDPDFKFSFEVISHPDKSIYENLLKYLDRVINLSLNLSAGSLGYTHIHLAGMDDPKGRHIIGEFIAIKFFLVGLKTGKQPDIDNTIEREIKRLSLKLNFFPEGVSGKSKKSRQVIARRKITRRIIEFYKKIQAAYPNRQVVRQTLVNLSQGQSLYQNQISEGNHFVLSIDEVKNRKSFVYTNWQKSRDELDSIEIDNCHLLDLLEHIILFDCEEKQIHRQFNYKELNEWNSQTSNFINLTIVSFGNTFRFSQLKSRIERIQSRFHSEPKFPDYHSYVVSQQEIEKLTNNKGEGGGSSIVFFDEPSLAFWEDLKAVLGLHNGLYELRSINMLNIYSMVINEEMKKAILSAIFASNDASSLISYETRSALKELSEASINDLKSSLSLLFDWIIQSNWRQELTTRAEHVSAIVLPYQLINNKALLEIFSKELRLTKKQQVITWKQLSENSGNKTLILSYRDAGQFPYRITPNLFEVPTKEYRIVGLFLAFFFERKYRWAEYSLSRDYANILSNPIRAKHFSWGDLKHEIDNLKPDKASDINWEFESAYYSAGEHATIKVKFKSSAKSKSYYPYEWFIVKYADSPLLKVVHLEDLINEDFSDSPVMGQCLDEIHSELNLYERLANVDREEAELKLIRSKYNLDGTQSASSLWKVLLKRKASSNNLYNELESYVSSQGLRLVSQSTFENNWLNPDSGTLIPREKKVFFSICQFLELPMTYYRLMLRKKNADRQETRRSTKQMSDLLSDLLNDGCFNQDANYSQIIANNKEKYIRNHDFDEIGISQDQVQDELQTLVNLLLPCLKLSQIESLEA